MATKLRTAAAAAAILSLTLAGCSSDSGSESDSKAEKVDKSQFADGTTMKKLADAGKMTVGTKFDQPLFGLKGPNGPVGFDVEIAKIIAAGMGIPADKIEWKETVSANRETFIQKGTVDMIVATYTINDDRKKLITFAGPYYEAGQALLVKKGNTEIKGEDSLGGKKVCSVGGSTPAAYIKKNHPDANLTTFDTYQKCVAALLNGSVDTVTTDNVILAGFAASDPDKLELVDGGQTFTKEPYGIGIKKGDTEFKKYINETLQKAEDDGSWLKAWKDTAGTVLTKDPTPPKIDKA